MSSIFNAQKIFDDYISKLDNFTRENVKSSTDALIMAEVLMVKVKELFMGKGYTEVDALLFVQHAIQELEDNKPTIH
jgi:phosphoheptose isomerase